MPSAEFQDKVRRLKENISTVIHGKDDIIEMCLVALLARGHVLLEDVPGVGKTTLAATIAQSLDCTFQRIQFTSDLLPSDILGVTIFDQDKKEFEFRKGPIFANVLLADEINRTTPKTQSAMLEAMNFNHVSMDGRVYDLPHPFIVIATQNPVEFHGTFPLPKSQMDRFMLRLHLGYPGKNSEMQVLREQMMTTTQQEVKHILTAQEMRAMQAEAAQIKVNDDLLDYIIRIAEGTRTNPAFELGCSTRGTIALRRAAQAYAAMQARDYVTPDDIKMLAIPVLAHRVQIARTFELGGFAYHEDENAVRRVLDEIPVPL